MVFFNSSIPYDESNTQSVFGPLLQEEEVRMNTTQKVKVSVIIPTYNRCRSFLFPQEIRYFLEVSGFETIDFYPFLEIDRKLTVADWNMMVVAR